MKVFQIFFDSIFREGKPKHSFFEKKKHNLAPNHAIFASCGILKTSSWRLPQKCFRLMHPRLCNSHKNESAISIDANCTLCKFADRKNNIRMMMMTHIFNTKPWQVWRIWWPLTGSGPRLVSSGPRPGGCWRYISRVQAGTRSQHIGSIWIPLQGLRWILPLLSGYILFYFLFR